MKESPTFSIADLLALVCGAVILGLFLFTPWSAQNLAVDPFRLGLAAGFMGLLSGLWGVGVPDDRKTAATGALLAGGVGLAYYAVYFILDIGGFARMFDATGPLFLVVIAAFVGLVAQYFIPRAVVIGEPGARLPTTPGAFLFRLAILAIVNVIAIQLAVVLGSRISILLGIGIGLFTLIVNIVFLDDRLFPWRWISPALAGMALLVLYPMGYSMVIAFTNYGTGHLLTKEQAIAQFEGQFYAEADAPRYQAIAFARTMDNPQPSDFRLWIIDPATGDEYIGIFEAEDGIIEASRADVVLGERDANGIPASIDEFVSIPQGAFARIAQRLQGALILDGEHAAVRVTGIRLLQGRFDMQRQSPLYTYDPATDTLVNNQTGTVYTNERGTFTFIDGETRQELSPGFSVFIGPDNFARVVTDPNVRDPFWRVFAWTVTFALGSVFFTFAFGLGMALALNARDLPLRPMWRSLLIIPYAVPFWLSVVTWRGLLTSGGPIHDVLKTLAGQPNLNLFADPAMAKVVVLFVNLYLGFPYMMLITLGALQAIPADMYEAALIDGANDRQQFQFITLPMILIAVGPLLVASFAFNFNNFVLIELLNNGGPPMSAATPAGHTDILLSYTYRLAFAGGRGNDYGFASAIGIFIFIIVGTITFINFRFTRALEEAAQ